MATRTAGPTAVSSATGGQVALSLTSQSGSAASPPAAGGHTGGDPTAELKREARERAMEERALGVTRMYQDNVRALNPYAHS